MMKKYKKIEVEGKHKSNNYQYKIEIKLKKKCIRGGYERKKRISV